MVVHPVITEDPPEKFVSEGATAVSVAVSDWLAPAIVTAVGGVHCVPVPSGGWIPPGLLHTVNCHWEPPGEIEALGHSAMVKLPVASRPPTSVPWMVFPPTLGLVPVGTSSTATVPLA